MQIFKEECEVFRFFCFALFVVSEKDFFIV